MKRLNRTVRTSFLSPRSDRWRRAASFGLTVAALCALVPVSSGAVVSQRIASGGNDVEQAENGSVSIDSTDLELVYDSTSTGNQMVGLRFTGLSIPQGATINTAYIQFTCDEVTTGTSSVTVLGEDADNSAAFTTATNNVSSRAQTSASVSWSIPSWGTVGAATTNERTPELKTIVQEIVDRAGFGTSSAMTFIITGGGRRTAEAHEGSSSQAALLYVDYTGGGGGADTTPPSVPTGLASSNVAETSVDLDWNASTDNVGVTGYKVYTNGSNPKSVTGTSTTMSGLTASTTYSFTVSAVDAADNESSQSSAVQVTTDSGGGGGGSPIVVSKRIAASLDDVEEYASTVIDATSTDIELVYDHGGTNNQTVGLRFVGLGIPQGATINTAHIQFTTDEADSGSTSVTIRGEDVNNSAAFTTTSGVVSSRTLTSASVSWSNIPAWSTSGAAGADQRTPELKSIVQEIVDRSGFGTSSAMTFIITGSGSRTAHSYDGSPSQAPLLYIEYTTGGGGGGGQSPYGGTAAAIPGRIDAENYDLGGQNVAYFDTTTGNTGGQYRSDDVDIMQKNGAYVVGYTANGEWLEYTVNVQSAGTYDLDLRYARGVSGSGAVRVLVGGVDKTGSIAIPSTGSWNTWTTIAKTGVELSAGQQIMRLQIDTGQLDINWVEFTESSGGTPIVVSKRVAASLDDAEEYASGSIDATSTDLELVYDHAGTNNQNVGMRFTSLGIPQGATINTAYIQFTTDEADSVTTSVTIRGEDVNNAAAFTTASGNISGRTVTSASVAWNSIPAWSTAGSAGADQRTPELKSIVQEIVNRAGFGTSSAMAFIITGSGTRTAHSYDGSSSQAPLLYIEYTGGGGGGGDTTPPTAPTNLVATAVSSSQINLSWTASSDNVGVTGYDIYRSGSYLTTVTGTSYSNTGLNSNTTYSYVVYAFDAADNTSGASNTAQATTSGGGGPPPGSVFFGNSVSRTSAGVTFTWNFNCGGNQCTIGKFVTGDYWIVPVDQHGVNRGTVTVTSISPSGEQHGAMVNPTASMSVSNNKQGLLPMYSGSYDANLNIMNDLPYSASPGESIMKISSRTSSCGPTASAPGCVSTGNVLTILSAIPPDGGTTVFRPPFHGDWKPLFTTNKVRFERLPKLPTLGNGSSPIGDTTTPEGAAAGFQAWVVPQFSLANGTDGWSQEFYRTTSPSWVINNYGASQAAHYLNNLLRVFGNESDANKAAAVYTLIQKGIDNYGVFKMGVGFSSGAGQHLGKAPPVAFFAAMYDDTAILNEIRSIATNPSYYEWFQEWSQIRRSETGVMVWGDDRSTYDETTRRYWGGHMSEYKARIRGTSSADGQGVARDPYNYIDGPGGGPIPRNDGAGRNYQHATAAGPQIGFGFAQMLMPWLEYAAGFPGVIEYADRYYKGRGIPNFDRGFWAQPDPCAPVDSRESTDCSPFNWGSGCQYYGVTWGPNSGNTDCIKHGGNPNTMGRWSVFLSGSSHNPIYPFVAHGGWKHELSESYRLPSMASNNWDALRDCADPAHPSYRTGNCAGLGPDAP